MATTSSDDWFIDSLIKRVPEAVAKSFTEEQLGALKNAFASTRHRIDIRDSYSLFGRGFYLVLLAGRERRPKRRMRDERAMRPIWRPGNIIALLVIGAVFAYGLALLVAGLRGLIQV